MGYYIETGGVKGKGQWLVDNCGAKFLTGPPNPGFDEGMVPVCVVDNGAFEAAAIAFDVKELEEFATSPDHGDKRPQQWFLVPIVKAIEHCGRKDVADAIKW